MNCKNPANSPENVTVNARFSYKAYSSTVGYQRKAFLSSFLSLTNFHTNRVPSAEYLSALDNDFAVFHHLVGVCYRDFESVLFGKLYKTIYGSYWTWPNIYNDKTCLLLNWDFDDLAQLNNPNHLHRSKL